MSPSDLERLAAARVYDPAADDAPAQRAILERLAAQGLTVDEIVGEDRLGTLVLRAFGHLIRPGERLTVADVTTQLGLPVDVVLRVWRAWGFPDPAPAERGCTAADADAIGFFRAVADFGDVELALHAARTIGTAMSRVAESEIALVRSHLEAPLQQSGASAASLLSHYANLIEQFLPATLRVLDTLHRHHLEHLARRYSGGALPPSAFNVVDLVVGFADLTGSTAFVQRLDLAGLDRAITVFEDRTSDLIAAAGATLVKRLGDAVMFVVPAPIVACTLALDLVEAFADDPTQPPVKVGLAAGQVVALRGDFYGPVVHLAARVVAAAPAATVLVAPEVRARVAPADVGLAFRPLGAHTLAGFESPVELHALERSR
jgi:class 3 adenylate cyclase